MRRCSMAVSGLVLIVAGSVWPATVSAQRPKWLGGVKSDEYQSFQPPNAAFTLEFPKKDWRTIPGVASVLVVFTDAKAEASVAIEHTMLKQALEPSDITQLFVDLEVENIKERDAGAEGFRTALRTDADGHRIIAIDFTRKGLRGAERVRQFSLPSSSDLYRLICSTAPPLFDHYAPLFEHMAESFKLGPGTPAGK
jgi:hypothetical protein